SRPPAHWSPSGWKTFKTAPNRYRSQIAVAVRAISQGPDPVRQWIHVGERLRKIIRFYWIGLIARFGLVPAESLPGAYAAASGPPVPGMTMALARRCQTVSLEFRPSERFMAASSGSPFHR